VVRGSSPENPWPKSAHDFLGLLYCFIVLLCIYVVSCPYMIYYPTVMVRYSLFVLKVPLNPKQTNKQTNILTHSLTLQLSVTCWRVVTVRWADDEHLTYIVLMQQYH